MSTKKIPERSEWKDQFGTGIETPLREFVGDINIGTKERPFPKEFPLHPEKRTAFAIYSHGAANLNNPGNRDTIFHNQKDFAKHVERLYKAPIFAVSELVQPAWDSKPEALVNAKYTDIYGVEHDVAIRDDEMDYDNKHHILYLRIKSAVYFKMFSETLAHKSAVGEIMLGSGKRYTKDVSGFASYDEEVRSYTELIKEIELDIEEESRQDIREKYKKEIANLEYKIELALDEQKQRADDDAWKIILAIFADAKKFLSHINANDLGSAMDMFSLENITVRTETPGDNEEREIVMPKISYHCAFANFVDTEGVTGPLQSFWRIKSTPEINF